MYNSVYSCKANETVRLAVTYEQQTLNNYCMILCNPRYGINQKAATVLTANDIRIHDLHVFHDVNFHLLQFEPHIYVPNTC